MATYDITQGVITNKLVAGDIINCPYSGTVQSCTLPAGQYLLEVWGASGGSTSSYGGYGGYSKGTITFRKNTMIYFYSGGNGTHDGFNGGGRGYYNYAGSYTTGGGGSDIRLNQDSLYARVIVAGGGGGRGTGGTAGYGCGGGLCSGEGYQNDTTGSYVTGRARSGGSATQTEGGQSWSTYATTNGWIGTFGIGGKNSGYVGYNAGGGGGGWYGGGAAYDNDSDEDGRNGGGGSGYVYTSSTASNYPSGCLLNSSYYLSDAQTIAGNQSFLSPAGASETGHSGDGYCRITVIKITPTTGLYIKLNDEWKKIKKIYIKRPLNQDYIQFQNINAYINDKWITQ